LAWKIPDASPPLAIASAHRPSPARHGLGQRRWRRSATPDSCCRPGTVRTNEQTLRGESADLCSFVRKGRRLSHVEDDPLRLRLTDSLTP
jgi:hypothetical protein